MEQKKLKTLLKKRKSVWVKVPFWLALVAITLATGGYLSYRYLINPPTKAADDETEAIIQEIPGDLDRDGDVDLDDFDLWISYWIDFNQKNKPSEKD
jgi:hypothetical protein